jgi:cell division protein FtsQ
MAAAKRTTKRGARRRSQPPKQGWRQRLSGAMPWLLASVALVVVLGGVIYLPRALDAYPVREVRVEGVQDERRQQEVQVALSEMISGENFFSLPLERIYQRVTGLSWVADASLRRHWPDRLVLRVEERVPVAVWNDKTLVSSSGNPFGAMEKYSVEGLPRLSGPGKRLEDVMAYYHSMSKMLRQVSLGIRAMRVDARLTAWLELEGGMTLVVDREQYASKLRRFVRLYRGVLSTDSRGVARVDLRYADGIAVDWRDSGGEPAQEERV